MVTMSPSIAESTVHGLEAPSAWVSRFAALVPQGNVLDVASGAGRHARYFARLGHRVTAVDRDAASLARCAEAGIDTLVCDLESGDPGSVWPFAPRRFQGVIVTNYLHRPLIPFLFAALADQGVLIYETFAEGNARFGKPSNPAFLLRTGELLDHAAVYRNDGIRVVAYEDGYVSQPKSAMVQRICVVRLPRDADPYAVSLA